MYADDVAILCNDPADLQKALDAATTWARSWRFNFAVGPHKTAVMCFGPDRSRRRQLNFRVDGQLIPVVRTCTYLGVVFHDDLNWRHHIDHVLARGERRMAACLSWTASHANHLPLHFLEGLFRAYVQPSVCFGLELVPDSSHLQRANARMFQWGRRLLLRPRGAPTAATQGQLGWA